MGVVRFCACCLGIGACLVTVGCGGGSSAGTTGGTTVPDGSRSTGTANGRRSIHEPVQSRGTKGEDPRAEAATTARISFSDCMALATLAEERLGTKLRLHSDASPPLSHCLIDGHGTEVNVYLDSGFAAHQRYANRIEETVQFNGENPAGLPQAVPHVGEKAAYNADANWIPALRSLLALRGNRWLTVTISVPGRSGDELRDEAAVLARAGFKLSAVG
jgi:uncharacterized RmlC-like cupin family protein